MNFIERFIAKRVANKTKEAIMLSGYKTYIVGVCFIVYGVAGFFAGIHESDVLINRVLEGLAFMGLRAGISKIK